MSVCNLEGLRPQTTGSATCRGERSKGVDLRQLIRHASISVCLLFFAAFFFPHALHAQSQSSSIEIVAGNATPGQAVTCPGPDQVCEGTTSLGLIGNGCRTLSAGDSGWVQPPTPIPICNTGYGGDGGPAIDAILNLPWAVTADSSGNVYFADAGNGVVRKIDTSGTISTVAWIDSSGNVSTTGPPATLGGYPVAFPSAVAVDSQGNLHVGVTAGGVSTLAMTTDSSGNFYSLVSQQGAAYTIYQNGASLICSTNISCTYSVLPFDSGFAGLAVDSTGNVYTVGTSGSYNEKLIKIDPSGNISVVVNASGQTLLANMPANGLTVDSQGNLYALVYPSPYGSAVIEKYNPTTQTWTTFAGTGANGFNNGNSPSDTGQSLADWTPGVDVLMPATQTDLYNAAGIFMSPGGVLYIADTGNNMIREVLNPGGSGCQECGPTSLAITDEITRPLALPWAMNPTLHKLYMVTSSNPGVVTVFNTTNDTVLANIQIGNNPGSLAVDSTNNFVYVTDTVANVVYVINSNTDQVVGSPVPIAGTPFSIAVDTGLNKAYVSISNGGYSYPTAVGAVSVIAGPSGGNPATHLTDLGAYGSAKDLPGPSAIVADSVRHAVYVRYFGSANLGEENYSLAVIDSSTDQITTTASIGVSSSTSIYPDSMSVDLSSGNVLIGDDYDQYTHLWEYSSQALSGSFGGYGGFYNFHVAADTINGIFYTWDGYGNVGYLIPNVTSGVVTSTSSYGYSNVSSVAVDSSTEQAYVVNCTSANSDGTIGNVRLWDGFSDSIVGTPLPLEIPSTAANVGCGGILVDTSNSNPALHSAWVSFSYNSNGQSTSQIDVIDGSTPGARPTVQIQLGFPFPAIINPAPFQAVGVGQTSAPMDIVIKNIGTGPLTSVTPLIQDSQDPGSLQIFANSCSAVSSAQPLATGEECNVELTFTPSQVETFSGSIVFFDNAPDTPQSVAINGSGVPATSQLTITPQYLQPGTLGQFYSQLFSTSGLVGQPTYTLTGTLPPDLTFSAPLASLSGTPAQADVGTWNFTISVTDSGSNKTGSQFYSLTITSTSAGQTTASLFGSGNSGTVNFGSIEVNQPSATLQTQVEDTGFSQVYANLQITGVSLIGPNANDFTESDNCVGQSVQEYQSCTINVTFTPTTQPTANEVAELVLGANAPLAPIYLLGTSAPDLGAPGSLPVAVSVDNGNPPNLASAGSSCSPYCGGAITTSSIGAISSGGRYVAFSFPATNLPGPLPQSSGTSGAYLRTTCVGSTSGCIESTQYISYGPTSGPASNNGLPCNTSSGSGGGSTAAGIDDTNQFVLFQSNGCNFSGSTYQNASQIFLRDVVNKVTTLISLDYTGTQVLNDGASGASMSSTAQQFAFQSASTNVASSFSNPNSNSEVYWRNNSTSATVLVSQDKPSDGSNDRSQDPAISASGRYVAYDSYATMIASTPVNNNTTGLAQVYLYDTCNNPPQGQTCTPGTKLISVDANGNAAGGTNPSVSSDGRFVAFLSSGPTLISATNPPQYPSTQVYLFDTCTSNGAPVASCTSQPPILISQVGGTPADENSSGVSISADGLLVTFNSNSAVLNPSGDYQGAVYKYTNCLAPNAPSPCSTGLLDITVDSSGNPLPSVNGGSQVDSTDQFFIFGEEPGGYGSPTEVYLGPTSPSGPVASFSAVFSIAGTTNSINFGPPFPIGEAPVSGECGAGGLGGGCGAVAWNGALISVTNTGNATLPMDLITITNTLTGQSAPFNPLSGTCQGSSFTVGQPTTLTLPPQGTCEFGISFSPTAPGTYNGIVTATGVQSNSLPMTGTVTGPYVGLNAPPGALAGQSFTYTVIVSNPTGSAINNVSVSIPVPSGTTLVSVTPQAFACTGITCTGSLPSAGSVSVNCGSNPVQSSCSSTPPPPTTENIVVVVTPTVGGTITETATLNLASTYPGFSVPAQTVSAATTVSTTLIPGTVSLSFSPASITVSAGNTYGVNETEETSLSLVLSNPNDFALTNVGLSLALPQGVTFDSGSVGIFPLGSWCGTGAVTITANAFSLTGGTLPANGNCTFNFSNSNINIVGLVVGNFAVSTGQLTFTGGTGAGGSATLTVTPVMAPAVSIAFNPSTVQPGGQTTLTFTVANPNQLSNLVGVSLLDVLPSGLVFASSSPLPPLSELCGSTPIELDGVIISLSDTVIPRGNFSTGSCTFSFTVTALLAGSYANTTQPVTFDQGANQGTGATASATLTVATAPANTATGNNVSVNPVDSATGTSPVTITFSNVTNPGTTTLAITNAGPSVPAGYEIQSANGSPIYFNLSTTATYSGNITVCFNYSGLSVTNPQSLTLFHYVNDQPPPVQIYPGAGGTLNTATSQICGVVTSLSPFMMAQSNPYVALTPGVISTLQSSTASGSILSAVAFDTQGDEYVLDSGLGTVTEYPAGGGQSTVVIASGTLSNPSDMAFGSNGTLYISDQGNARIVAVTFNPSVQVTPLSITGAGAPTLMMPTGIAVGGPSGDVFVSDPANGAVFELGTANVASSSALAYVGTVIGAGSYSGLTEPLGLAVDSAGDVFVANSPGSNPQAGNILEITAGTQEPATSPMVISSQNIAAPYGLALDPAGDLYYTDAGLLLAGRVDTMGNIVTVAGNGSSTDSGNGGLATQAGIASPLGIALDAYNKIYIADSSVTAASGGLIRLVDVTTSIMNFSSQADGTTSSPQNVLLTNPTAGSLSATNIGISGADAPDFAISPSSTCATPTASLASAASCSLTITFTPIAGAGGSRTASLTFQAGTNTQTIQLSGTSSGGSSAVTPTINWSAPAAITYGTALSATQLNATVTPNIPGTFTYTPALGTVLNSDTGGQTQTLSVVFTPTDTTDYTTANASVQITVNPASLTVSANNASRAYGAANPTFTGSITGAVNGDTFTETFSTTATATSGVGTYPITPGLCQCASAANYNVTIVNGTLTITQAGSSVQLSTSANGSVTGGTPVVLTAKVVSATTGTPTGSVTFLNGSASLSSAALSQGVATLTVSTLPSGNNSITAQYSGDTNFTGSTSPVETVSVNAPDYTVSANPNTLTLAAGQSGTTTITVTPEGYSGTVSFSCGSLPSYITCTFSPSSGSVTFASGATAAQTITLTVAVASTISRLELQRPYLLAMAIPLGLLGLLPIGAGNRKRLRLYLGIALLAITAAGAIAGCAGGGSSPTTATTLPPAGSQSFTVTASGSSSSGTISHQLQLTIDVTN